MTSIGTPLTPGVRRALPLDPATLRATARVAAAAAALKIGAA